MWVEQDLYSKLNSKHSEYDSAICFILLVDMITDHALKIPNSTGNMEEIRVINSTLTSASAAAILTVSVRH